MNYGLVVFEQDEHRAAKELSGPVRFNHGRGRMPQRSSSAMTRDRCFKYGRDVE